MQQLLQKQSTSDYRSFAMERVSFSNLSNLNEPYYRLILKQAFQGRQLRNRAYSLRAFSKAIELSPGTLSAVLKGKRGVPRVSARKIARALSLSPIEEKSFLESVFGHCELTTKKPIPTDLAQLLEETRHFEIISKWEYYAILSLIDTRGFKTCPDWIGKRLGITPTLAAQCLKSLLASGLIEIRRGKCQKTSQTFRTSEDLSSRALLAAHREELAIASQKLEEIELMFRDFSSITFAMNLKRLPEIKTLIRQFRKKLIRKMESGEMTDVYQLNFQLYPLTSVEKTQRLCS